VGVLAGAICMQPLPGPFTAIEELVLTMYVTGMGQRNLPQRRRRARNRHRRRADVRSGVCCVGSWYASPLPRTLSIHS
jgi:hypothetical protein